MSQLANERYATALAKMPQTTTLKELAEPLWRAVSAPGKGAARKVRGLNPPRAEDAALVEVVSDPKHVVNGLRNRDLVAQLDPRP